ncbi:bifunctional helix-turn-helix transcriptional regulator/GNAT family N-acetyltransferase [Micromonospora sp. WMMA1923]|uniref:bifunctional helix-turn-helix transcriptional regulator/GNAT family N-acetyltransferase n=1 Tax=Micromonospora sp. WMMA1923 TaxID=3404125 RepID=UPI003B954ABB
MDGVLVGQVRRFNRTVTQRIGVLTDTYLARGRSLGQCRVLWEVGPEGIEVRALRARLDLDSGYLSRLLRALETEGLVVVEADDDDARVRRIRLTPAGVTERAELDRRSDELAASILTPLDGRQRDRLVAAMAEVERLLLASMVEVTATEPTHADARHCLRAYAEELNSRFAAGFDLTRAQPADLTPPAGLLLVARLHAAPVGCGALVFKGDRVAEIKRLWVSTSVRGLGLGRRLLTELETTATDHGVRLLRLDTNSALPEATALYRSAGYQEVDRFNDDPYPELFFAKQLG